MAVHNEDSRVKIPTILHIVTFGYDDLSLKAQKGNSNLFNDIFNCLLILFLLAL